MCTHLNVPLRHIITVGRAPLKDGHHTAFDLYQCGACGKFVGFPQDNLVLALSEGTEETLRGLVRNMIETAGECRHEV